VRVYGLRGRDMRKQDIGFDYHRYHRLLSEAVDEPRRLELIEYDRDHMTILNPERLRIIAEEE